MLGFLLGPIWVPKIVSTFVEFKLKSNIAFYVCLIPLEAFGAAFGVHVGVILECFLGAQGGKIEYVNNRGL